MLDFDYICGRSVPSVSAIVYTFSANHYRKFYWGSKEIMLPVYQNMSEALRKFPQVDVCVNFASSRSVFDSTKEMIGSGQLNVIAVIAEGNGAGGNGTWVLDCTLTFAKVFPKSGRVS